MNRKFPWADIMHLGLGVLHLAPKEFWCSTLREIFAATGAPSPPLLRQNLDQLMQEFPD